MCQKGPENAGNVRCRVSLSLFREASAAAAEQTLHCCVIQEQQQLFPPLTNVFHLSSVG